MFENRSMHSNGFSSFPILWGVCFLWIQGWNCCLQMSQRLDWWPKCQMWWVTNYFCDIYTYGKRTLHHRIIFYYCLISKKMRAANGNWLMVWDRVISHQKGNILKVQTIFIKNWMMKIVPSKSARIPLVVILTTMLVIRRVKLEYVLRWDTMWHGYEKLWFKISNLHTLNHNLQNKFVGQL